MSGLVNALVVAAGGALGALGRWGVAEAAMRFGHAPPVGTLVANMVGCFLIGVAKAAMDAADWGNHETRLFLVTGFLGAFTTFSTFEADAVGLWRVGERGWFLAYWLGSVGGGLLCFLAGWFIAYRIAQ